MPATYPGIISSFDPRVEAALAQLDTADDALRLLDDSADGRRARAQIRREMAERPANAMVNLALRRQRETGEEGTSIVKPLLVAMGYPASLVDAHLPQAQRLYAKAILASQKALRHGRAT